MNNSSEELKAAIAVAEAFWQDYTHNDKSNMFWDVLQAMVSLVKESSYLEAGVTEECYFTSSELAERAAYLSNKKASSFNSSRLNAYLKKLNLRLDELAPSLERIAAELGFDVIPAIYKESNLGGQGKQSIYRLYAKKIETSPLESLDPTKAVDTPKDLDEINYYLESVPKLPIHTRWLHDIDMDKHRWKMLLFTGSPVILPVLCVVFLYLSLAGLVTPTFLSRFIMFTILYVAAFLIFFRYLIDVLNNNITTIPDVMLPLSLKSAVLHYELKEPGSKEGRIKRLAVKVYKAKCPVCGYRVDIKPVGLPFRSRLIGVCDNNPLEHRYSFDFTTQKGTKLT
ncbi:hypothetical protein VISI1226_13456 [Vibrio sinaloensis DSM 21326]|uniref:Uncharacterized protein n=1 Tax=Vibrio sinaloensis DSM 21326 TaxID=945550 RepID=E8M6T7_PHOS4|nr:hypothetical protein [Vibrio sinaloensis]EGA70241.1 hypothetical protein VISI1226_13456 [Vibrio sinaloensis DSM 21326]